jgi:hypothetical protein
MAQIEVKTSGGDFGFDDARQINDMFTELYSTIGVLKGDYLLSKPGLVIGTTPANVANVAFTYTVGGVQYSKGAVAAGVAPGNDIVPANKYGAVALDINASGTVTVAEAAANATGYATAALALAAIPAVAANLVRMGTVTVIRTAGDFTFGTTSLADATTTAVYTDGTTATEALVAIGSLPATS